MNAGAKKNNTYINFSAGTGHANIISANAGHEFRWGDFGLDLSAGAMARKHNNPDKLPISETTTTTTIIPEQDATVTSTSVNFKEINYNAADKRIHVGAEGTYRPSQHVKLGLGGEVGVTKSNVPGLLQTQIDNPNPNTQITKDYKILGSYNNSPKVYATPTASIEIEVYKDNNNNNVQLTGAASLYESRVGVQCNF